MKLGDNTNPTSIRPLRGRTTALSGIFYKNTRQKGTKARDFNLRKAEVRIASWIKEWK